MMIKSLFVSVVGMLLFTACASHIANPALIRDCPDEKIINKMPVIDKNAKPSAYFIYKGERRELSEFDLDWVEKNCKVKESVVY